MFKTKENTAFLVATYREAKLLKQLNNNYYIAITGIAGNMAETKIKQLNKHGVKKLICFGTAGALKKSLKTGDCFLPLHVMDEQQNKIKVNQQLREHWQKKLQPFFSVLTQDTVESSRLCTDSIEKKSLHNKTHAWAVDMEAHKIACIALKYNFAYINLRFILDELEQALPFYTTQMITSNGKTNVKKCLLNFCFHPKEYKNCFRLFANYLKVTSIIKHGFLNVD